jgi:rubredoxin
MNNIKPIETVYKGYRFRSRLEARWAVFFDALGIKWLYEPEGFTLEDDTHYLPDFFLPDYNLWIEIKGVMGEYDSHKISMFRKGLTSPEELLVLGNIPPVGVDVCEWVYDNYEDSSCYDIGSANGWDFPYIPCVCPVCGKVGFEFDGRGSRICNHDDDDKGYSSNDPRIIEAYRAAHSARFEWGENGAQT